MTSEIYSARVRKLFGNPAHAGSLAGAHAARVDDQGVSVQFFADVADGRILELRFLAWGCPHVIAAAEALCAQYERRPVSELESFEAAQLMQSLSVPVEKTGRILVIEDAVRSLAELLGKI
ncbi:MAG: iron-sulfur cluster assembly scaffold protein [Woeseiaceae bacterium]|jgi:NifU-like protein involved in Fe-S cluster formation